MSGYPGSAKGGVRALLHLEGIAVLTASVLLYRELGGEWKLFALLFLLPDLSMLGYLAGRQIGAVTYNIAHAYVLPLALGAASILYAQELQLYALIWLAHIGIDRAFGYGLKYTQGFGFTHLGRIGKAKQAEEEFAF